MDQIKTSLTSKHQNTVTPIESELSPLYGVAQNNGWDLVSVVKRDYMNTRLANEWSKNQVTISFAEEDISVNCVFSPFQIIEGGSGKNLRILLPIKDGTYQNAKKVISLDGINLVISCTLGVKHSANQTEELIFYMKELKNLPETELMTEEQTNLILKQRMLSLSNDEAGAVYPIEVIDTANRLSSLERHVLLNGVCIELIKHPEKLAFIFARINLLGSTSGNWLYPAVYTYHYLDAAPGYLAMLAMCRPGDISKKSTEIAFVLKEPSHNSLVSISSYWYMENLLIPSFKSFLEPGRPYRFIMENGIFHNTEPLKVRKLIRQGIYYYPVIQALNARIVNDELSIQVNGNCDLHADIHMTYQIQLYIKPKLSNGSIQFYLSRPTQFSRSYHVPLYLQMLLGIAEIIAKFLSENIVTQLSKMLDTTVRTMNLYTIQWSTDELAKQPTDCYFLNELVLEYHL